MSLVALAPSLPIPDEGMGGSMVTGALAAVWAVNAAFWIYVIAVIGKWFWPNASWKDDDQIGLKTILAALIFLGGGLFAGGFQGLLHLLLTFKDFAATLKVVLPDLLVGVAVLGGVVMFAVPKTNHGEHPKVLRMTAGAIALTGAIATVLSLDRLLTTLFHWPDWYSVADSLTTLITSVAMLGGGGYFFAKMSGMEVPDIQVPTQAGSPPVGGGGAGGGQPAVGGYQQPQQPPQQPGYQAPPQQQPPAQGGYQPPPQQPPGGYQPPQGGGYQPPSPSGPPAPSAPPAPSGPPRPQGGYRPPNR